MTKHLNILQRINEVRKEVTYIQKDKKQGMRYSVVSHDVVTAKLRSSFVNHGIVYWPLHFTTEQFGNRTQAWGTCRFACIDDMNDYIDVYTGGYGIDEQDKGPGKALSYACKYALLKVCMLETGDDPDLDQHVKLDAPADTDLVNVQNFEAAVDKATTIEALEQVAKDFGVYVKDAEPKWPAQVAAARQSYSAQLRNLKQGEKK